MPESSIIITLVGGRLAKPGTEFIFRGPAAECEGCKLRNVCLNLDKGKKYRVVAARNGNEHDCKLHASVRAAEVAPCPIVVAIESRKAFNGSKIVYEEPKCEAACPSYAVCHPPGLVSGDKYTIAEVLDGEAGACPKGLTLKKVELRQ